MLINKRLLLADIAEELASNQLNGDNLEEVELFLPYLIYIDGIKE